MSEKNHTGLTPLCDMAPGETYKGEPGGLYGRWLNTPPKDHLHAAMNAAAQMRPLDCDGHPSPDGRIVLVSIGMSNTTQSFARFMHLANCDPDKSPLVGLVDCAQNGRTSADWAKPGDDNIWNPWRMLDARLAAVGVTHSQTQAAWVKLTKVIDKDIGEFPAYVDAMSAEVGAAIRLLKRRFPNLRLVYLSSRTYGGYATTRLNPEPLAYEGAFAMRRVIQAQIDGDPELNHDPGKGPVNAPVILWGPYLWADGMRPRHADGLVWERGDFEEDGTHPTDAGRLKVAKMLLRFLKTHPTASPWFVRQPVAQ